MLNSLNNPLRVALLSISPHNRAILEFFFAGAGKNIFQIVSVSEAEALVVDFDHPGARQEWEESAASVPAIVLSVKDCTVENTIWVPKPLTSQSLVESAEQIRKMLPDDSGSDERIATSAEKQRTASDMSSLRELLDSQREDKQVFGLSGWQQKQKEQAASAPRFSSAYAPDDSASVAVAELDEAIESDEEQLIATEDVYVPEPLSDDELLPDESGLQLGQVTTPEGNELDQEKQEQRWELLCGNATQTVVTAANWQDSALLYTPENYLLNSLVDALNLSRTSKQYVQVILDSGDYILLMPDVNLAYSSVDLYSESFSELCDTPLQGGTAKLHLPSAPELSELNEVVSQDVDQTYDLEGMIWTTSLLTSRGRLSRNADLSSPVRLKSWPNLTRLEQFPDMMPVAALWNQKAGNVFDFSEWLDVPQRHIIAFFNGAHTLGLFEVDHGKVQQEEPVAPKKNRGLFSRLLKRLLGGGSK